jgi:hypothetical protein
MRNTLRALSTIAFLAAASGISTGEARPDSVAVPTIAAQPADVATIDGVMKAFYEVISGPAGQPRQWSRDRTLYIPEIRFVSMDLDSKGKPVPRIMTHQQFVDASNPSMVAKGFDEREIHRVTKRFGNIAHVFSTYETRQTPGGPLTGRGINSIELFWDGDRWWIANAIWDDERPDNPIPKEYLP